MEREVDFPRMFPYHNTSEHCACSCDTQKRNLFLYGNFWKGNWEPIPPPPPYPAPPNQKSIIPQPPPPPSPPMFSILSGEPGNDFSSELWPTCLIPRPNGTNEEVPSQSAASSETLCAPPGLENSTLWSKYRNKESLPPPFVPQYEAKFEPHAYFCNEGLILTTNTTATETTGVTVSERGDTTTDGFTAENLLNANASDICSKDASQVHKKMLLVSPLFSNLASFIPSHLIPPE